MPCDLQFPPFKILSDMFFKTRDCQIVEWLHHSAFAWPLAQVEALAAAKTPKSLEGWCRAARAGVKTDLGRGALHEKPCFLPPEWPCRLRHDQCFSRLTPVGVLTGGGAMMNGFAGRRWRGGRERSRSGFCSWYSTDKGEINPWAVGRDMFWLKTAPPLSDSNLAEALVDELV